MFNETSKPDLLETVIWAINPEFFGPEIKFIASIAWIGCKELDV